MAHSVAYSRGHWYAKRAYDGAKTDFEKMKVLTKLYNEASMSRPVSLFDQGIFGFVKQQRVLNAKKKSG